MECLGREIHAFHFTFVPLSDDEYAYVRAFASTVWGTLGVFERAPFLEAAARGLGYVEAVADAGDLFVP